MDQSPHEIKVAFPSPPKLHRLLIYVYLSGKASVETYDDGEWRSSPKMRHGRHDFAACVVGTQIFVAGGVSDSSGESYVHAIEIFTAHSRSWTVVSVMHTFCRKSFSLVRVNDKMYAVGGDAECTVIWNDSMGREKWSPSVTNIRPLSFYEAFALNGAIYVVGKKGDDMGSFRKLCLADHEWQELQSPSIPWSGGARVAIVPNRRCDYEKDAKKPRKLH